MINVFYLFVAVGVIAIFLILQYEKQNRKKVNAILRANKNVPPLFMLRSAELKVNAIRAAINTPGSPVADHDEVRKSVKQQLEHLINDYTGRNITLATYYSKLGALLISVNELKGLPAEVEA
ncbi:MAG: hypothetical protein JST32_10565 [Bacteroidetes bacterium]|nr:hypothetical protein [Bacteroidota bacterium]